MADQVVVTGLGMMSGLGLDLESSWQGLIAGQSVTAEFRTFDPVGLDCPFGVELPLGAEELFKKYIKPRRRGQMTTTAKIALVTSQMALKDSGLELERQDKGRIGVVLGSTGTGYAPLPLTEDRMRIIKNMSNAPGFLDQLTVEIARAFFCGGNGLFFRGLCSGQCL